MSTVAWAAVAVLVALAGIFLVKALRIWLAERRDPTRWRRAHRRR
jgi:hypothetical protein